MRATLVPLLVVAAARVAAADPTPGRPQKLPTEYVEDRFYVTPRTADGAKLRCYTDSGGGGAFLFDDRARTMKLPRTTKKSDEGTLETVAWPPFAAGAAIPPTIDPPYWIVLPHTGQWPKDIDCFLGQSWFGGRVWTFDYPGKTLWWRAPGDVPAHERAHEAALTFRSDKKGARENQFPRIVVSIDGEELPLLFDTGAMITHAGVVRGGSFITARTFDKWHKKHPDWRVTDDGDEIGGKTLPVIEVPAVTVGGFTVGPVRFAKRADKNFDDFMSSMTAGHVEGALGGSALRYLRVTVDYPRAIAVFEKP
jgi:hypothetical protein